ncbi:MAG TPA: hypothetical protein VJ233_11335, partial [Hyphomicrobiaceae bacterium]|nr:hypothetical protein [Hyphomicrobiaceae bacterium]
DGNTAQLRAALARLLSRPSLRAQLRRGALARRRALPTWEATAEAVHLRLLQLQCPDADHAAKGFSATAAQQPFISARPGATFAGPAAISAANGNPDSA